MQTFLPYPDFRRSASVLDRSRLGKQRVETYQIMDALVNNRGWIRHPAVHMWRGYEYALLQYQYAIVDEWRKRGYEDTCLQKTYLIWYQIKDGSKEMPPWLGDKYFHISHQSNLIRKDPDWYEYKFPGIPPDLPYIWPVDKSQEKCMPQNQNLLIEGAQVIFRNFAGRAREYNAEGERNFVVILEPKLADRLEKEGWNVKSLRPREDGEEGDRYIKVDVNYKKGRPPRVVLVSSNGKIDLGADQVEVLDYSEISNWDVLINPYNWDVNGNKGVKAYLHTLVATIVENELDKKYANVPDINPTTTLNSIANDEELVS